MDREISWIKAAEKEFKKFPKEARLVMAEALDRAALGGKSDIAKPMKGLGAGVFEIALAFRGDAYRAIYAIKIGADVWVIDAFQKKSKRGIKTPKEDVERIRSRLKQLKEALE